MSVGALSVGGLPCRANCACRCSLRLWYHALSWPASHAPESLLCLLETTLVILVLFVCVTGRDVVLCLSFETRCATCSAPTARSRQGCRHSSRCCADCWRTMPLGAAYLDRVVPSLGMKTIQTEKSKGELAARAAVEARAVGALDGPGSAAAGREKENVSLASFAASCEIRTAPRSYREQISG